MIGLVWFKIFFGWSFFIFNDVHQQLFVVVFTHGLGEVFCNESQSCYACPQKPRRIF